MNDVVHSQIAFDRVSLQLLPSAEHSSDSATKDALLLRAAHVVEGGDCASVARLREKLQISLINNSPSRARATGDTGSHMPTYGAIRAVDGVTSMVLDTAGGTREALQAGNAWAQDMARPPAAAPDSTNERLAPLQKAFLSPPCRPVLTENMSQGVRTLSAPVQKHDAATAAIKAAAAAEHEERESRWLEKATHRLPYEEDDFGDGSQAPRQRKQKRRGGRGGGRGRGRGRGSRGGDDGDEDEEEEEEEAAAAGACVVVPQRAGGSFMTAHARLRLEAAARGEEPPPPQQQPAAPSGMPPYKAPGFTAASGFRDPSAPRQAGPAWTAGRPAQGGRAQGPAGRGGGSQGPPGMRRALQSMNNEDGGDGGDCGLSPAVLAKLCPNGEPVPDEIRKIEPELVERICNEILDRPRSVTWDSIAGLEHAKQVVQEVAVWPMLNPELFRGPRAVPKGLLLFGPPGTGKTLIARALASQCNATFFGISASSLGSKWIGEGEKLVRALFAVAGALQPAVIFIDEVDSLLSARKGEGEHESSRRLKTEFLIQMEGIDGGGSEDRRILLVGATNRPHELDDAARRRLAKQVFIPLPCAAARRQIILQLLNADVGCQHTLSEGDVAKICEKTEGYSGSDMKNLVQEAARAPLRELRQQQVDLADVKPEDVRAITVLDFKRATKQVRASVTKEDVAFHEEWNRAHGALSNDCAMGADDADDDW